MQGCSQLFLSCDGSRGNNNGGFAEDVNNFSSVSASSATCESVVLTSVWHDFPSVMTCCDSRRTISTPSTHPQACKPSGPGFYGLSKHPQTPCSHFLVLGVSDLFSAAHRWSSSFRGLRAGGMWFFISMRTAIAALGLGIELQGA